LQPGACSLLLAACSLVPDPGAIASAAGIPESWPSRDGGSLSRLLIFFVPSFFEACFSLLLVLLNHLDHQLQRIRYSLQVVICYIQMTVCFFVHSYSFLNTSYHILHQLSSVACCLELGAFISRAISST